MNKLETLIGKSFICKSNEKEYTLIDIMKYKDERSNGWIEIAVYKPNYECDIPKFSRSVTMFNDAFYLKE